jgi:hypothetical protein
MKRVWFTGSIFLCVLLLLTTSGYGQVTTATIFGTVLDPSGSAVPGAVVTVASEATGTVKTGKTDERGAFTITFVPIGTYTVSIEKDGFNKYQEAGLQLTSGQSANLSFSLTVGSVSQTVDVSAERSLVDATSAQQNTTISSLLSAELPVQGRDFSNLVNLSTGVLAGSTESLGTGTGTSYGVKVAFNGLPPTSFKFTVDGTDASGDPASASLSSYQNSNVIRGVSLEAIQEVQVAKNIFSAEISGTMSGNVNIVTKGGTNNFHGSAFELYRAGGLNAYDPFVQAKAPQVLNQFGVSGGGPIIRNKLFFFGVFEGYRQKLASTVSGNVPTPSLRDAAVAAVPAYKPYFDAIPLPNQSFNPSAATGLFIGQNPASANDNHVTVRGDWNLTNNQFLNVRFTRSEPLRTVASVSASDPRTWQSYLTYVTANYSLAKVNWSSQVRFGYAGQNGTRFDQFFVNNILLANGPGFVGFNDEQQNDQGGLYNLEDVTAKELGRHSLKFGGIFQRRRVGFSNPQQPSFSFLTTAALLSDTPDTATFVLGSAPSQTTRQYFGAFIQDDFRLTSNLMVNMGVRYDYWTIPQERDNRYFNREGPFGALRPPDSVINPDRNNFSPRIGIAWSVDSAKKTVVKIGSGFFISEVPIRYVFQNVLVADNATLPYRIAFSRADALKFGIKYPYQNADVRGFAVGGPITGGAVGPNYPNPYSAQWTLSVSRQLTNTMALEIGYVGNRGVKIDKIWNLNRVDRVTGIRPNPAFSGFQYADTSDSSYYEALQIALRKRFASGLQFDLNHTYSKSMAYGFGDLEDATGDRTQDNNNLKVEKSRTPFDASQRFTADFLYELPLTKWWNTTGRARKLLLDGWQASGIFTAQIGLPVEIVQPSVFAQRPDYVTGQAPILDNYRDTLQYLNTGAFKAVPLIAASGAGARPGTLGRFAIRAPGFWNIDGAVSKNLYVTERMRAQLRVDMFNALNHVNYTGLILNPTAGNFGRLTGDKGPRTLQLSARFTF